MAKIINSIFLFFVSLSLVSCGDRPLLFTQTAEDRAERTKELIAELLDEDRLVRASKAYNVGDVAQTRVIEKTPFYIFMENTTLEAKPFSYWSKTSKSNELRIPGAFVEPAQAHCEKFGKDRNEYPTRTWQKFPTKIAKHAIVIHCVGEAYTQFMLCKLGENPYYVSPECQVYQGRGFDFSNHKTFEYFSAVYAGNAGRLPGAGASGRNDQVIQISSGTGFAVSKLGHIVTNSHVISGCNKVLLVDAGKYIPLDILASDPINDLAVLKGDFSPPEMFPVSRASPKLMQDIYVAGYPFGRSVSASVKVTKGIVSSLTSVGNNFSGLQIDAAVQPGNSGGPIFDRRGSLVGVVVSKLAKQGNITPENTNFGVKSNILANLLESNSLPFSSNGGSEISRADLGKKASEATFYLSCWSTAAEARSLRASKAMFGD